MRKNKKNKENNKNLRIGIYFGIVVLFIVIVSVSVKIFDSFKNSTFDGNNFYTVAVISDKNTELLSVSPRDNSLKRIKLEDVNSEASLRDLAIPIDSYVLSSTELDYGTKSFFTKMLINGSGVDKDLTIIDLIRLSFYSNKLNSRNIEVESAVKNNSEVLISEWFKDPEVANENISVEITNTTDVNGLGARFADTITNAGGNVVLVHGSQDESENSIIYYKNDSYTVKKISKLFDIPSEKKDMNSVSEIVIEIGTDKEDY